MFLQSKKKRLEQYLQSKSANKSAFDELLQDYADGALGEKLTALGVSKTECRVDWLGGYKSIDVQGKYRDYYVNVQVDEKTFSIACDKVEPDDSRDYPLETKSQMYSVLEDTLKNLA